MPTPGDAMYVTDRLSFLTAFIPYRAALHANIIDRSERDWRPCDDVIPRKVCGLAHGSVYL